MASKPLVEATFTQIINDVNVLTLPTKASKAAKVSDVFKTPDLLRTGRDSLAEMVAADKTLTRVGANTVFSFDPKGRNINLEEGSVLFHSPSGKGGGTIKTKGASASVLGTTIVVVTTINGGFKALVLEGKGVVRLPNGNFRILQAGQLIFVLPGAQNFGPLLDINLDKLVKNARLVHGFENRLPSMDRIEVAIAKQAQLIESGGAQDTGLLVGNYATDENVRVVDSGIIERVVSDTPLQRALNTDVIISTPSLDSAHLFLEPFNANFAGVSRTTFRGFIAHNITITSPLVDLIAYTGSGDPFFDMLASGMLHIENSVSFSGNASGAHEFLLGALEGIQIAPGSVLSANNLGLFEIASVAPVSYNNVTFHNLSDGVLIGSTGGITMFNGGVTGDFTVELDSDGPINVSGTSFNVGGPGAFMGFFSLEDISVCGASLFSATPGSFLVMDSGGVLSLSNTTLNNNFANVTLAAQTLVLQNIDFPAGSSVFLFSANGQLAPNPNTGASVQPGYVNFISNVDYNGSPAQFEVGNNIIIGVHP